MNRKFIGGYSAKTFEGVDKQIRQAFLSKQGPGVLPRSRGSRKVQILLVPQGSYEEVGSSMAWAYKEVAEKQLADVYIVLGGCDEEGIITNLFADWETPLGVVKVNKELGEQLVRKGNVTNDYTSFVKDTVIERQLSFLQFACMDSLDKVTFIPLLVGKCGQEVWKNIGDVIGDLAESHKVCIICCSSVDKHVATHLSVLNAQEAVHVAQRRGIKSASVLGVLAEIATCLYLTNGTVLSKHNDQYTMVFT